MSEHILFLTGHLAYPALCRTLDQIENKTFTYHVHDLGLSVAALMTTEMVQRRLNDTMNADRIIVPGLCSGPLEELNQHAGIPVEKGPKDLKDLPEYFGSEKYEPDLSRYSVKIFAEIVEAPEMNVDQICQRAQYYAESGADVIDLGCLPQTPFPHLEESIAALREQGFEVSIDSVETDDLLRGGNAGADYLLSLKESTAWIADEIGAMPVLIPEDSGDMDSLYRLVDIMEKKNRHYYADPILDPIHFGFTDSIARYHTLRHRLPDIPIMMGTGNLSELTDADTTGITALLIGIVSELDIGAILTTEVSPHARSAVKEADIARRVMYLAKHESSLPRGYSEGLMALRERKPFIYTTDEISEMAQAIRDPSFRVQLSEHGIHVYNRDGLQVSDDPFEFFPHLKVDEDGAHAFYLGVELARAQIAWQLGKRYNQDQPLSWGCIVPEEELGEGYHAPGTTLQTKQNKE